MRLQAISFVFFLLLWIFKFFYDWHINCLIFWKSKNKIGKITPCMGTGQQRRQKMLVLRKVSLPHLSFHSRRIQSRRVTNWPGLSNTVPVLALKQASQDSWSLTSQSSFLLNCRLPALVGHSSHVSCFATAGRFSKDGLEDEKKPQEHHLCGWFQGDLAVKAGVKRRLNWAPYWCGGWWAGGGEECERRLWARMEDEGSVEESVWSSGATDSALWWCFSSGWGQRRWPVRASSPGHELLGDFC